jgi:hypothetical protein
MKHIDIHPDVIATWEQRVPLVLANLRRRHNLVTIGSSEGTAEPEFKILNPPPVEAYALFGESNSEIYAVSQFAEMALGAFPTQAIRVLRGKSSTPGADMWLFQLAVLNGAETEGRLVAEVDLAHHPDFGSQREFRLKDFADDHPVPLGGILRLVTDFFHAVSKGMELLDPSPIFSPADIEAAAIPA